MFLMKNWELFYTHAKGVKEEDNLVDQVSIDTVNKRYVLDEGVSDMLTDGYDEENEPIYSTYVSREVFAMLVDALKRNGYKSIIFE